MKHIYKIILFISIFLFYGARTAPAVEISVENAGEVRMLAFGDIMMARNVEAKTDQFGLQYPFEKILPIIKERQRDFVFANLEGPIMKKYIKIKTGSMVFSFASTTAKLLKENGFNIVSLANNHLLDRGEKAYLETKKYLSESQIANMGHPKKISNDSVYTKSVQGINFVFIALNSAAYGIDEKKAIDLIKSYNKPKNFIIATIHWGDEYKLKSNTWQKKFAHKMIDNGASIIIGHHPHVVQEIEKYKNKLIFYSLGNFIFDQYWSKETQEELGVDIIIDKSEMTFRLIPIQSIQSQPQLMDNNKTKAWLKALADRSNKNLAVEIKNGLIKTSL